MTRPSPYAGMTVNERLEEAGLYAEFEKAMISRDRTAAIAILQQVDTGDLAKGTVDTVLRNPAKYGF